MFRVPPKGKQPEREAAAADHQRDHDGDVLQRHEAAPGRSGQIPRNSLTPIACEAIPATSW